VTLWGKLTFTFTDCNNPRAGGETPPVHAQLSLIMRAG